ncbi:MAG: hypothetical protein IJT66_00110, partial [Clostridia bacterium]|nr:hypothetical protein [Clostridia bacterium]
MKRILIVSLLICTLLLSAISSIPVLGAEVSVKTLEDIIKAVESADESNFTPEAWTALQENYDLAKRLSGDQQYFTIRADVPDEAAVLWDSGWPSGHNNYNKYVSILKDSTQAYLAYKGHGNNDYEKSDFSTDQLWEKVMVDED